MTTLAGHQPAKHNIRMLPDINKAEHCCGAIWLRFLNHSPPKDFTLIFNMKIVNWSLTNVK